MITIQLSYSCREVEGKGDDNNLFVVVTANGESMKALTPGVVSEILHLDAIRGVIQVERSDRLYLQLIVNGAPGLAEVAKAAVMAMAIEYLSSTP